MKKRFGEEQIIGFLKEADRGVAVKELCRRHGFSEASYYLWRSKFGGMDVSDATPFLRSHTMNRFSLSSLLWTCVCLLSFATATAGDSIVAAPSVPDLRPSKLCAANALNLSRCARAWQSLVRDGTAPKRIEDTWNAAEFEGIVNGFTRGVDSERSSATKGVHRPCRTILESYDELYTIIAKDLIAHSERLTVNDDTTDYLRTATKRLLSCG